MPTQSKASGSAIKRENDSAARRRWLSGLIAVYWLGMFLGTHIPHEPHLFTFHAQDKLLHFSAYAGLAVLLSAASLRRHSASAWLAVKIVLVLAAYGAIDEITQPLVQRDCELLDWVADTLGAAVGSSALLAIAAFWNRAGRTSERGAA